ncbi:hypothetical protein C7I87_26140 [Mesorhizobium sp. SARCC-RB16n]|uniref:hypothetical protein n=1 Tax=Mesorhizobium sp. SARCC-RB16n TaxID=2116687 RepID=UPI00122F7305|nr:hypothetical protein [Mesorhizobium sp. SARCC-RB16n]KAA3447601.1 hypothetical protein C7I87_26140 [Mesorhizobium sp. SARCC-RB16n]
MATKAKKPARAKSVQPKAPQSTAGAGPAVAQRSKDAKPAFGKAPPKKVVPGSAPKMTAPKTAAKTAQARKPAAGGGSKVRTAANIAAGAVVATARGVASLAASVVGRGGSKAKAK